MEEIKLLSLPYASLSISDFKNKKLGTYEVTTSDCDVMYVVQTREFIIPVLNGRDEKSSDTQHALENN